MAKSPPYPWLKPAVFVGSLTPLVALFVRLATESLGANPISAALNLFGLCALIFLVGGLLCTPLLVLFKWTWAPRIRRMLGLYAFFYATLHFGTYLALDQSLDFSAVLSDIGKRNFILVGFLAWLILIPLSLTSTDGMVKRLGYVRWKKLHRLNYVAVGLGCLHFFWRVKKDLTEPLVYAAIVGVLLLLRRVERKGQHLQLKRSK